MVKSFTNQQIFVVDDDLEVLQAILSILERAGYQVSIFNSAQTCLENLATRACNLLITDVKMPVIDGFELLARTKEMSPALPVMMITGYGDIPMAVKAIKAGAGSFIEKPLEKDTLLQTVAELLQSQEYLNCKKGNSLSKAEKCVLELVLAGYSNREIAERLYRSIRTVEDHRRNIMLKLDVKNIVELVKVAFRHNLIT
jgi:two-component system response regulator FixJ